MPILHGNLRKPSPLEDEESTRDVKSVSHIFTKQLPGKSSKMTGKQAMCVESLVADIASLILTTRQNDESTVDTASLYMEKLTERGRDGDGGGRRGVDKHDSAPCEEQDRPPLCTVNKQKFPRLLSDLQTLWNQDSAVCIEVRGHAKEACSHDGSPSVLLELWTLQVVAKRSPPPPPCSPRMLLQAVQSHLHFSQIRSWQEVGMCDPTHPQFRLGYRLGSLDETVPPRAKFSSGVLACDPVHHTFPLLSLHPRSSHIPLPHSILLVSVSSLPRLRCILRQLHSTLAAHPQANPDTVISRVKNSDTRSPEYPTSRPHSISERLMVQSSSSPGLRECFPFSPPLPSPLSPKLLSGLPDRVVLGSSLLLPACASRERDMSSSTCPDYLTNELSQLELEGEGSKCHTSSTVATTPRASGSPAPFSSVYESSLVKRRSCALTCKRPSSSRGPRIQRCNSAPVNVSSLCLLGTFEESILNVRLEPCGYVDGFTAELAASGSFCPPHVTLPVVASFYSLHDNHGGTSPYLGQVDLSSVGKRGYQVPCKGTVQVMLFNPHHTVVKIYIVPYDYSDMPPSSQTFLRQKTLSYPTLPSSCSTAGGRGRRDTPSIYSLHYLIHLRFLCSKSKRVYLHRDIRMIFARRAPDTEPGDSHVTLLTTTEGPEEPKYSIVQ